ncbi:MAG: transporter [Syntrophobacteria bacterium]
MKKTTSLRLLILALGLTAMTFFSGLLWAPSAQAYDLPLGLNLGFTSFLDGAPPAGPGFYYTQYLQFIGSNKFTDDDGDDLLPGSGEDLDAWVSLSQFIYQSDQEVLLGAKWGLDVIVPYVAIDLEYDTGGPFEDNGSGFGDLLIGPMLQWDPVMGENGPIFVHRLEFQMIFPTGKYDDDKELNPSSNFFSFNPYWSGTFFFTPKWTASWRFHYLWNAKNDDPNRYFGDADDSRAGQAIHVNYTTSYELLPRMLHVGLNGYYLKQLTDTEVDGHDVPDRKEEVLALGPGAVFHFSQHTHFFFNAYFETQAENRPEGNRFNMRVVHHF